MFLTRRSASTSSRRLGGVAFLVALLGAGSAVVSPGGTHAAFPGGNGRIAFVRADLSTGSCPFSDIWTMDADGRGQRKLERPYLGVIGGVAWSPDGKRLAFTVQTELHEPEGVIGVHVINADGTGETGLRNVPVPPGWKCDPQGPTWSPDGTRLAVGGVGGIWTIDLANGNEMSLITASAPDYYDQPAWSPDGKLIAVRVPAKGAIGVIPAAGGAATLLTDVMAASRPNWSPDGKRIAFEIDVGAEIGILDRCTDSVSTINRGLLGEHHPAWSPDGQRIAFEIDYDDSVVYIDVPVPPDAGPEFTGKLAISAGFRGDILTTSPDRDASVNLTKTKVPSREAMPDWQPVGKPPVYEGCSKDLVVNSAADRPDTDPGDGGCDTGRKVADKQECTLRAAIQESNKTNRPTKITFRIPDGETIRVTEVLPAVAGRSVIDGTTQDGGWVVLDGSGAPADGIRLLGSQSTVRGLVIGGFPGAGVVLGGRGAHEVLGNRIGTTPDGTGAVPNGIGVRVTGGAATTIGGEGLSPAGCAMDCNLISGNTDEGILLEGGSGHRVEGNVIGLALDGSSRLPNRVGIKVHAQGVQVGDDTGAPGTSPGNVVSANTETEVWVRYRGDDTRVEGNLIGLDITGAQSEGGRDGVRVDNVLPRGDREVGSPDNVVIGGPNQASRNVVRGDTYGIVVDMNESAPASPFSPLTTFIWSNFIGTDITGHRALGGRDGVVHDVQDGRVVVGPPVATEPGAPMANLISGNETNVIIAIGTLTGNLIGTDITGGAPIDGGPAQLGVQATEGVRLARNLISGNASGVRADGATLDGNLIGTDITGTRAVPNAGDGIWWENIYHNYIVRNVIAGNGGWGIRAGPIKAGGASVLAGNLIGTDITGTRPLPNGKGGVSAGQGIRIGGAKDSRGCYLMTECDGIGQVDAARGPCAMPCNVIAGNAGPGVVFDGTTDETSTLFVAGNYVGVALDGTDLPNAGNPVVIESAPLGALVSNNRILSTLGPGVLAPSGAPLVRVHSNRTDMRTVGLRFEGTATAVPVPAVPDRVVALGRQLTVEGQALYDADDAVVLKVYTAATCEGPERLVATVKPEESTNEYEWVGPRPEDAVVVLLQAVPTAGLRGSSEFSECTRIVDGS